MVLNINFESQFKKKFFNFVDAIIKIAGAQEY